MGTYNLPRNVKGEGRILFVFSAKGLIWTTAFGAVGLVFYYIFSLLGLTVVGIVLTVICALIGFIIGTFKMPNTNAFDITRKTGNEEIDDVIKRVIAFKRQKNKIYVYEREVIRKEEETKDE